MTFDRLVRCRWDDVQLAGSTRGLTLTPEDRSLLEVKCAAGMPLWLVDFLSAEGIRKGSFSKYGAAVCAQLEREAAPGTVVAHALRQARSPRPRAAVEGALLLRRVARNVAVGA